MKCKHCMCPGILLRKFCNLFKNCALPDKQDIKLHGTCIRSGAEKVSLGCFWRIQDRGPLSIEVAAAASCKLQSSCWLSTGGHVSRLNKKHLESRYLILGQFGAFVYCLRGWYAILHQVPHWRCLRYVDRASNESVPISICFSMDTFLQKCH